MQSYPFTSDKITYDEHGLPKYDRAVDSAFLRKVFAQYFSDGVFYSSANALQVVADTGMQVAVEPGSCHIQGAIGIETNRRTLVVQAAEEMDRIDTVVARLDLSLAVRSIDLYVVKGTAAESPQAPALTRDSTIWELGLANLFVAKNVATISQQRITDTRLDTSRCGQVGAPVQPPFDTEAFFSQLEAAIQAHQEDAEAQIEQLRNAIEAVEGDAAWMMKEHYDPAGLGKDITVQTYTHSKSGTVHEFTGTGANGRAKMTADVQAGDTFMVNGAPVTAYMGSDDAADSMAGSPWNGKWVSFIVEGGTLNFNGGGAKYEPPAYSTSEAVDTGFKWTDGKPIFMRTISVTHLPSSDGAYYGIDDVVDTLVRLDALVYWQDGTVSPLPFVSSNASDQIYIRAFNNAASSNKNTVRISVSKDNGSQSAQITVFYTRVV